MVTFIKILFTDMGIVYHSCFYRMSIANPEPIEFAENDLMFIGCQVAEFEK